MFKGLLYLALLTAAVAASWIGFSVFHNYSTSTISSDTGIIITPIPSGFDRETIEKIKAKKVIRADLTENLVEISEINEATEAAQEATGAEQQPGTGSAQQQL
ncbi:MAG: hypothetical protein A3C30_04115 [Candidatus Levybacteria bacterium RIFCSPHIGHO2_02_FULL_40_18]|nr:MAG: hypothetical protein A2869_01390 [Candidatus Levybacteria bacterium RIFCSPHIGHO2_01_FULL_40_58]OGH26266.1 MAG: hypothetical protein A3C30_04115 [Candidatus Levybacteria bacterium RIFCSPHIGHO2_02_FULL_40_18]OGH31225.1 MAG: hypothetical protein A3E43_02370 [Candidatus Levybacteria bacterium RIFCSPHIGHO2_12_FULL_40_31]OGH39795.1 MAG: hypothetical protein A2894_02895 [Candidatus Levybacteria bacterium RIFCSPLOWO2_01_FULL_40_64]OGH49112.1 MAG: hypothetical protein A3I54_00900 [Candidatus Lev